MPYGVKTFTVQSSGAGIEGVAVYIYETGTDTEATLYSSASGGDLSNPLTTDANGVASCFLAAGFYDAKFVHGSYQEEWERNFQITTGGDSIETLTESTAITEGGYYDCDCTTGNQSHTMPDIAGVSESDSFAFKKIDTSEYTVALTGDADFEQDATLSLQTEGFVWAARSGTWRVIGRM